MASRTIAYAPLDELVRAPRNPKGHDDEGIAASIKRHGYVEPIVVDERTGKLVAGHGRLDSLLAAQTAGENAPEGIEVADDGRWMVPVVHGWASKDDDDAEAFLVGVNELTIKGGWDHAALGEMLSELAARRGDDGLVGTGYSRADLDELLATLRQPEKEKSDGKLLALSDVVIGEPKHHVERGDQFAIGTHVLVCADVMDGWSLWAGHLDQPDALFVPYAGPYAALSRKASQRKLVLVQPDPYLAGHVLDKYAAVRGDDSITKL